MISHPRPGFGAGSGRRSSAYLTGFLSALLFRDSALGIVIQWHVRFFVNYAATGESNRPEPAGDISRRVPLVRSPALRAVVIVRL